jgi:HPt (histidine-containing phosphotransfer) domain-containing protein
MHATSYETFPEAFHETPRKPLFKRSYHTFHASHETSYEKISPLYHYHYVKNKYLYDQQLKGIYDRHVEDTFKSYVSGKRETMKDFMKRFTERSKVFMNEVVSIKEAADYLGVSERMVFNYVNSGILESTTLHLNGRKRRMIFKTSLKKLKPEAEMTETETETAEAVAEVVEEEKKLQEPTLVFDLATAMRTEISKEITEKVTEVEKRFMKENEALKKTIESLITRQDKIDAFITEWRQEQERRKKPWWKRLLGR